MKRTLCFVIVLAMMLSLGMQALAQDAIQCRECGREIPADSKVCPYCGKAVVTDEAAEAPADEDAAEAPAETASSSEVKPFQSTSAAAGSGVRVTKNPTSESICSGSGCAFIAHADNADSVTWYIANSDASVIMPAAEAPGKIPGLAVSGADEDTLHLSYIPSSMSGYQVQACFIGEGGPVYSDAARIWITSEPAPSGVLWGFWDIVNYYLYDDPDCPKPWYMVSLSD